MTYGYAQPQYAAYPAVPAVQPRPSAPPSVHVVAILHYLGGLLQLAAAAGLVALVAGGVLADRRTFVSPAHAEQFVYLGAAALGLFGLVTIMLGRKLQRGRQWARVLMIVGTLIGIAGGVATTVHSGDIRTASSLLFPVLYLLLLNTRAARSWFRWHIW
jgi:uncharacterized membrane protein